jgi:predicted nucleic acid-binding protein
VHVPALLLYEVGNVLLLKTRLVATRLDGAMDHLETLPFVVAPPATPLLKRAALCPYITADRRLYDRARTLPRVRHLSRVGSLT